ncbi:MAG: hypothetical protein WCT36_02410 [Candidatus Gracilibacteria bacterium]|jgi:hypothetical protein
MGSYKSFFAALIIFVISLNLIPRPAVYELSHEVAETQKGSAYSQNLTIVSDANLDECKNLVQNTLNSLPQNQSSALKKISLIGSKMDRRGYGGYGEISLQCSDLPDSEIIGVFTHEIGHVVDDSSNNVFYKINWIDSSRKLRGSNKMDFVTGYAMTDAFEDFAESYTMYILHGNSFRNMADGNEKIKEKYYFMKDDIFNGVEFFGYDKPLDQGARVYDSTRI